MHTPRPESPFSPPRNKENNYKLRKYVEIHHKPHRYPNRAQNRRRNKDRLPDMHYPSDWNKKTILNKILET